MNPSIPQRNPTVLVPPVFASVSLRRVSDDVNKLQFKYSYAEEFFSTLYPAISIELRREIRKRSYTIKVGKQHKLVSEGEICSSLYLLKKGLLRGFVCHGKEEITTWFGCDNEPVIRSGGLMSATPAKENIVALKPCSLVVINRQDLEWLFDNFGEFIFIVRLLLEEYSQDAEERAFITRLSGARDRFQYLFRSKKYHKIIDHTSLKYVASFLGMRKETLCRIRSGIVQTETTLVKEIQN